MSVEEVEGMSDEDRIEKRVKEALERKARERGPRADSGGGAMLDAQIAALTQRLSAVEDSVETLEAEYDELDGRVTVLEAGETPEPPDPEPPDPEPEPDQKYPERNDPMCGVPEGVTLERSGSISISEDGTVIEGKDISGTISVSGRNVVIRNCRITSGGFTIVQSRSDPNFEMDHCEIVGNGSGQNGFDGTGHIHHCRILNCENPINISGDGALIEWNDIHDLDGPSTAHKDGIQVDGGIDGLTIQHNYIDNQDGETSAVMLDNYWGPLRNVTVDSNFLGGGGFPAYLDGSFNGAGAITNIVYSNNDMRAGGWGGYFYWNTPGSGCKKTGNVDYKTGASVDNK